LLITDRRQIEPPPATRLEYGTVVSTVLIRGQTVNTWKVKGVDGREQQIAIRVIIAAMPYATRITSAVDSSDAADRTARGA
jgi:hypothetical protein